MFLIRPPTFQGESLSSWRQRSGIANGFWRFPQKTVRYSITDPDRFQSYEDLTWLSDVFGTSVDQLEMMTLDQAVKPLITTRIELSKNHWLLPIGYKAKQTSSGPTFCPDCLASDNEPYFRLVWRLSFIAYCPTHRVQLRDRCNVCSKVVWPSSYLLITKKWINLRHCQNCGNDLTQGHNHQDHEFFHETSDALWKIYSEQKTTLAQLGTVHSQEYFGALWAMCQIIMRRRSLQIQQHIPVLLHDPIYIPENITTTISIVPLNIRIRIITAAVWLLQDWPYNFQKAIAQAKITRTCLLQTKEPRPTWMTDIINQN